MRLVGETHEMRALHISNALSQAHIEHRLETHGVITQIWVVDEDLFDDAQKIFTQISTQDLPLWRAPPKLAERRVEPVPYLTYFFLALCVVIYGMQMIQPTEPLGLSPIQRELLYDIPDSVAPSAPSGFWRGFYDVLLLKLKVGDASLALGQMFGKIRHGEVWRLFSPSLLHGSFLHILFNMIWLWVLGRPIEQRIGSLKTLLLILILGVSTNTIQYLMSGPFFLGYSGIIMGFAGFIWMRERIAPWEGYPLNKGTLFFLALFVLSMVLLQTISFFVQVLTEVPFALNIANSAHIAGALIGALLACSSFFSWRPAR